MKIKVLNTGKTEEVSISYACRMIEQGKAVPAPPEKAEKKPATPARKPAPEPAPEGENK